MALGLELDRLALLRVGNVDLRSTCRTPPTSPHPRRHNWASNYNAAPDAVFDGIGCAEGARGQKAGLLS